MKKSRLFAELSYPFKRYQWELGFTLLSLHLMLVTGVDDGFQPAFVLCHFGFFLLWQPVWQIRERASLTALIFLAASITIMIFFLNWWLIAFWLSVLFALLGGRILSTNSKSARLGYLLAASYLLAALLLWVVPKLLHQQSDYLAIELLIIYGLPIVPFFILFTRVAKEDADQPPVLDFFYTLILLMLAIILVLGAFAIQTYSQAMYAEILFKTLLGLAVTLAAISWLWNPRAGFSGMGNLLSRYLLSIGLPFEQWVKKIAELASLKSSTSEFTSAAMAQLMTLPWVSGVEWRTIVGKGKIGLKTDFSQQLSQEGFELTLYTDHSLTPTLILHLRLLGQILAEFYETKYREETMAQNAYMQAIYETGARLTHDIKNIVQSMGTLCMAAEQTPESENDRLLALLRRQLPLLNQRLTGTLAKLEAPGLENTREMSAMEWWLSLRDRYSEKVTFMPPDELLEEKIDAELLDSVIENLLQNALTKGRTDAYMDIRVEIGEENDHTWIEVIDTGKSMPEDKAQQLFKKQVSSEHGLGIGLFHAGKQAEQAGYRLSLKENKDGEVRFRLNRTKA